jgi:putative transposase
VPKRSTESTDSSRFPDPGFGWSRQVCDGRRDEQVKQVTIIHKPDDWYVAFCVDVPTNELVQPNGQRALGVDRGCAVAAATSDDRTARRPDAHVSAAATLQTCATEGGPPPPGSLRWLPTQHQIATVANRAAQRRKDFVYQSAHRLAREHFYAVLAHLRVKAMTHSARGGVDRSGKWVKRKAGLNRAILDKGWEALHRRLVPRPVG